RGRCGPERRTAGQADRLLPAPVPSDRGERCVVGPGVYGVGQRRQRPAALPRPPPAAPAGRAGLLRPARAGDAPGPGRPGPRARRPRLLLLPLLVQWPSAAPAAPRRRAPLRPAGLPLLPVLGERKLDAR